MILYWSQNLECLISKTNLMVFGLENIGSVVLLLNDGHEGKFAASGVCREMAWVFQRVIRNGKCKQALQHGPVSALVPRVCTWCRDVLSPNRQLYLYKRTVLSAEWKRNIIELLLMRLCVVCHLCVRFDRQLSCCVKFDGCDVFLNCWLLVF
jgi:hypothetical protein